MKPDRQSRSTIWPDEIFKVFCDIGIRVFPAKKLALIVTAIDNLGKGAAGQAVQNMNLMCGFEETDGF